MANATFTISYTTAPSTAITLTPVAPFSGSGTSFTAAVPVPAATVVGILSVSPVGWSGVLALSGPVASHYTLSGTNQLVTSVATTLAAIDSLVVTATP